MRLQARQHREARQHVERAGRDVGVLELAAGQQLLVDLLLLGDAQAVGHLDDADAVEEGLVVLVGAEALPLALVGVGDDQALIGHGADVLGADVGAVLRGGEQRVQHLERRLEHLDELEKALRRAVEAARVGVGVGVVLAEVLELADVDLADQRRDVLVVLVARLGLGHADLAQLGGVQLDDRELGDVAAELVEPLHRPRRHVAEQQALRDAVALLQRRAHGDGIEQPERALEDRADAVVGGQHVDRALLHQVLEALGQRGLAAADRARAGRGSASSPRGPARRGGRSRRCARWSPRGRRSP